MAFPCTHFSAAVMTSQLEESTITGTFAISGSAAMMLRNVVISCLASSKASSILISMTRAPSATCLRAMVTASSYFFSLMSRRNFLEPATLHRSPTLTNPISGVTTSGSRPLSCISGSRSTGLRGVFPRATSAKRRMKCSSVPQQPPMMFTRCSSTSCAMRGAMVSAVSS